MSDVQPSKGARLVTVVVATHNRARYAIHCVNSILDLNDMRLEIVVHDTSTDGGLDHYLAESEPADALESGRLVYRHAQEQLSMTENYERGIGLARGEYVCLIGDDDTVLPSILTTAEWAVKNQVGLVSQTLSANYAWPDFRTNVFGARHAGRVYFNRRFTPARQFECEAAIAATLANAGQGADLLPRVYHGLVSRHVLHQLIEQSGRYIHGPVPDVSLALGVALTGGSFVEFDFPFTLPGAAGGSNTGRVALNDHQGPLDGEPLTRDFSFEGVSKAIPAFFSVETVWAQAAIETLKRRAPDRIASYNFARLYALIATKHSEFDVPLREARSHFRRLFGDDPPLAAAERVAGRRIRRETLLRHARRLARPTAAGGRRFIGDLENIREASFGLQSHLEGTAERFESYRP
jgi:hypothetical protein